MAANNNAFKLIMVSFRTFLNKLPHKNLRHHTGYTYTGNRAQFVEELMETYKGDVLRGNEKLTRLKELVQELAGRAAKSELARKMRVAKGYYTVEMAPPTSTGEMKRLTEEIKLLKDFMKPDVIKLLTVKQAWLSFLVAVEVGLWFFLGETIGKWKIVGYGVEGCGHH